MRTSFHKLYHQFIKQDSLYTTYNVLTKSQYWSKDEIEAYQVTTLKKLMVDAYCNVPYYKHLFDVNNIDPYRVTSLSVLDKLPLLTKELIREHRKEMLSKRYNPSTARKNSTSGSTGESLYFYSPRDVTLMSAAVMRSNEWMKVKLDDKKCKIWGCAFDHRYGVKEKMKAWFKNTYVLSGYHLSDTDMRKIVTLLKQRAPKLVITYPSILERLCNFIVNNGLQLRVDTVQIGGEKLFPHQRDLARLVLGAEVFDFYGARDIPSIAMECDRHAGLHVMSENVIIEVMDSKGNPVTEGEGDLIVTHLHNWVMPFIRYRIGDRVRVSKRKCACGRTLPLIEEVMGRSFDMIEFPNGNSVMGTFWTLLLKSKPGIRQFTVHQVAKNKIVIRYCGDKELVDKEKDYFVGEILRKSGDKLKVEFEWTDVMSITQAGKLKFVVNELLTH